MNPFFTIAIPTKNRPERLGDAVKSVLLQTFPDFEIIVCDNSDELEAARTAEIVRGYDDPRISYIRTSGQLSMPDNWERAIADARGEYVGILTDRSVFRRDALELVNTEIEKTGARLVSWFQDHYGRDATGRQFRAPPRTLRRHQLSREAVFDYFINGHPKYSPKIIPKLMTSVCHRSVLDAIRASAIGRCCPPVCPDYTSGFLMLGHCDWVLILHESLFVSCGTGNGAAFRRRGELAERFRRDLGMDWSDLVDRMPSDACFTHGLILNDLMRLRDMMPDRLQHLKVNNAQYYIGCLYDYVKSARRGVDRSEDFNILLGSLDNEPAYVQKTVRATKLFVDSVKGVPLLRGRGEVENEAEDEPAGGSLCFDTVFDAMAGAEMPGVADKSFLDTLPRVEQVERWQDQRWKLLVSRTRKTLKSGPRKVLRKVLKSGRKTAVRSIRTPVLRVSRAVLKYSVRSIRTPVLRVSRAVGYVRQDTINLGISGNMRQARSSQSEEFIPIQRPEGGTVAQVDFGVPQQGCSPKSVSKP